MRLLRKHERRPASFRNTDRLSIPPLGLAFSWLSDRGSGSRKAWSARAADCRKNASVILFDDFAFVHEDHAVGDGACKPHLVGHAQHGHAGSGQLNHGVEHFLDHLRVKRRGRLVEQHDAWVHAQRACNGDALLLTTRKLAWVFEGLLWDFDFFRYSMRLSASASFWCLAHPDRAQRAVFQARSSAGNRLKCWNTMPTSRRIASICLRSLVSSMPSTMI